MHRAWVTGHKEGSGAQPSVDKIASLFAPSLLACCRVSVHFFALFCAILGPIFGSFLVPKMRPRFCYFNCKCINGLKSGPNFGSNFGYHFWAPKSATFLLPCGCPGQNFGPIFGCLGLAVSLLLICKRQRWQDPMLRIPLLLLCRFRGLS